MPSAKLWIVMVALCVSTTTAFSADERASKASGRAKSESESAEVSDRPVKLVKPWSQITSLREEQKQKISAIHRKALDEIKVIEAKEKQDILAVLSDEQKAELKAAQQKDAAARKAARGKAMKDADSDDEAKASKPAKK